MRLDKFICKSTQFNRQQAIDFIHQGEVAINDHAVINERSQVHKNNTVKLKGEYLTLRPYRYIMIHKTVNTICSNTNEFYPSLFNEIDIDHKSELHIAGRLDADTTGLVLITDDGHWSFNITSPQTACEKAYRVKLRDPITDEAILKFKKGIQLQGQAQLTLPAKLVIINSNEALLTITQGKYHQVKRMFAALGNRIEILHRERIGSVSLDIEEGQWRYLTKDEINDNMQK